MANGPWNARAAAGVEPSADLLMLRFCQYCYAR